MNELYTYWSDWSSAKIEEQSIDWIKEDEFNWDIDDGEIEINIQTVELDLLDDQELKIF